MKTIKYALLGCLLAISGANAYGASCEVTYKAQKTKKETFLFRTIENLIFKSGTLKGKGSTKTACKKNALKPLKKQQWKVTYSKVKMN